MSKSTKSPAAVSAIKLDGKTAAEIRAHLEAGETTAKAVVSYLSAKETLRAPSKKLLAELTGAPVATVKEVAKVATVKEVAKATPVKVATPTDLLTATIAALTARVAALEAAAAPAKAAKVAPVVAAPPVKAKVVAAPPAKAAKVVAAPPAKAAKVTEAAARGAMGECTLAELRKEFDGEIEGGAASMTKRELIEFGIEMAIEDGFVVAAAPVAKATKLSVVAAEIAAELVDF